MRLLRKKRQEGLKKVTNFKKYATELSKFKQLNLNIRYKNYFES